MALCLIHIRPSALCLSNSKQIEIQISGNLGLGLSTPKSWGLPVKDSHILIYVGNMAKMIAGQLFSGNSKFKLNTFLHSLNQNFSLFPLFPQIPEFEGDLSADC